MLIRSISAQQPSALRRSRASIALVLCVLGLGLGGCPGDENDSADADGGAASGGKGDPNKLYQPGEGIPGFLPADSEEPCKGLKTEFAGDDSCIAPPKEGEGIQLHVGPKSYTDPEELKKFLIMPGQEVTECYYLKTPNTENAFYYARKFRMRPGSHHLITNFVQGVDMPDGWGPCNRDGFGGSFGGAEKAKVDYPTSPDTPGIEGYGKILPRNTQLSLELHHINTTDKPILREAWLNIYWKPQSEIKTWVQDMFVLGGLSMNVPPGGHQIYHNKCVMEGEAKLVDIYGHFHAHTVRFSAWRQRGDEKKLFYEVYDWHDTPTYSYDAVTKNPEPNPETKQSGAASGDIDLKDGDLVEWECEINNDTDVTLKYRNELQTGEMCNLFGTYIGNGKTLTTCRDPGVITNL